MSIKLNIALPKQLDMPESNVSCNVAIDLPADSLAGANPGNGRPNGYTSHPPIAMPDPHDGEAAFADEEGLRDRPAASKNQLAYLRRLADEIDSLQAERLDALGRRICGKTVAEFRDYDAGRMIDLLKKAKAGLVNFEVLLHDS
jgi:hypothetical protein